MSMVFDALKRRRQAYPPGHPDRDPNRADVVLATLGYSKRRPGREPGPIILMILAAILLIAGGWIVYRTYFNGPSTDTSQAAVSSGDDAETVAARPPSPDPVPTPPAPATSSADGETGDGEPAVDVAGDEATATGADGGDDAGQSAAPAPLARAPARPATTVRRPTSPPLSQQPRPVTVAGTRADGRTGLTRPPLPPSPTPGARVLDAPSDGVVYGSAVDHFKEAIRYQRAGDFSKALSHYQALIEENGLNAEARNNLGLLYQENGRIDEAIEQFQRALMIDPAYVRARNNLGVAWLRRGRLAAAADEFRAALATDESNLESITNLAVVMLQSGDSDQARTLLELALSQNPRHAASHYNLALIADRSGDRAAAVRHYTGFINSSTPDQAALAAAARQRLAELGGS